MSTNAEVQPDGCLSGILKAIGLLMIIVSPWIIVYCISKYVVKLKRPLIATLCGIIVLWTALFCTHPLFTYENMVTEAVDYKRMRDAIVLCTAVSVLGVPFMIWNIYEGERTLMTVLWGKSMHTVIEHANADPTNRWNKRFNVNNY